MIVLPPAAMYACAINHQLSYYYNYFVFGAGLYFTKTELVSYNVMKANIGYAIRFLQSVIYERCVNCVCIAYDRLLKFSLEL